MLPLAWYLLFYAIFAAYPFVFRRRFAARTGPWAVAALGGVAQFPLVYWLVQAASRNQAPNILGVLPALLLPSCRHLALTLRLRRIFMRFSCLMRLIISFSSIFLTNTLAQ
jgi:hypothetical protein